MSATANGLYINSYLTATIKCCYTVIIINIHVIYNEVEIQRNYTFNTLQLEI